MDWQRALDEFSLPSPEDPALSGEEGAERLSRLARSLENARRGHADIALIDLRRIVRDAPGFGAAHALQGLVEMQAGWANRAEACFRMALEGDMTPEDQIRTVGWLETLRAETAAAVKGRHPERPAADAPVAMPPRPAPLLEPPAISGEDPAMSRLVRPAREGRRRARMASRGERRRIAEEMKEARTLSSTAPVSVEAARSERSQKARPAGVRVLTWVLAASVSGLVLYGAFVAIPAWIAGHEPTGPAGSPTPSAYPSPDPSASASAAPSPTLDPTPSPVPTPSREELDRQAIAAALPDVEIGEALAGTDMTAAADRLLQARDRLEGVPDALSATSGGPTAGDLRTRIADQFRKIGRSACSAYRVQAEELFGAKRYEEALVPYLKAYAIDPGYYGGGVAYYIGRCYQLLARPDKARPYFQFVVDNFQGRDIAEKAAGRLLELAGT